MEIQAIDILRQTNRLPGRMTHEDLERSHATHGFWDQIKSFTFESATEQDLPRACDRFYEARYFLERLISIPRHEDFTAQANWHVGAILGAFISIRDAARADFGEASRSDFNRSDLGREFYLRSDDRNEIYRDPVAINRAYRDLRNLRVHQAIQLVVLEQRMLTYDLASDPADAPRARWFFRPIVPAEHDLLGDKKLLTPVEIQKFNTYHEKRTIVGSVSQHLRVMRGVISTTAKKMT